VLVTHGPPQGYGDRIVWRGVERQVGCADLLARVRAVRPRLHLFGHIHQAPGRWEEGGTTFANVTTDDGKLPVSVFDLAT
jgi:Icc-related predicted phosphoesterase